MPCVVALPEQSLGNPSRKSIGKVQCPEERTLLHRPEKALPILKSPGLVVLYENPACYQEHDDRRNLVARIDVLEVFVNQPGNAIDVLLRVRSRQSEGFVFPGFLLKHYS